MKSQQLISPNTSSTRELRSVMLTSIRNAKLRQVQYPQFKIPVHLRNETEMQLNNKISNCSPTFTLKSLYNLWNVTSLHIDIL